MGSLRFRGVLFVAYPNDHPPRHVHGFAGGVEVIVNLLPNGDVAKADRWDAIRPANAKRSDVKKVLASAAANFEQLVELWETFHGNA